MPAEQSRPGRSLRTCGPRPPPTSARTTSTASSCDASTAWVAPSLRARSSFDADTSIAMSRDGAAMPAPCTTFEPDAAAPDHGHGLGGAHLRDVEHRADARHHGATDDGRQRGRHRLGGSSPALARRRACDRRERRCWPSGRWLGRRPSSSARLAPSRVHPVRIRGDVGLSLFASRTSSRSRRRGR